MTTKVVIRNEGPGKVKISQVSGNTDKQGVVRQLEITDVLPAGTHIELSVWIDSPVLSISEVK